MDKKKMKKILCINFIVMSIFSMAHPVTPTLINELGLPTYMFGVFYSTMAIANFIMSPIWGSMSDTKGRKKFLILGVVGYGVGQLGFGFSGSAGLILLFRILGGGMAVSFITVAIAYVTDISGKKERVKYMSYHTATLSIGSSVGALLGGYIGTFGYKYTFLTQSILSIIAGGLIYIMIDETINVKSEKVELYLEHLKFNKKSIDYKSTIGVMMLVMMLITITTTSYNSTINYYIESVLNMPTIVNGLVMAVAGVVALIMNLIVNPFLANKFDEKKNILWALITASSSIIIASISENIILSLGMLLVFIGSSALITPLQQSIVSKLAKDNYGQVMGIQGSFKAIGMILGSLVSGFIFDYGNKLPFILGGVCCLIGFIIILNVNIENKSSEYIQELKKAN